MTKPLVIASSKHVPGLYVYCSKCDTVVSDTCKFSELPIEKCRFGEKHRYKGVVYLEGGVRKTKTFERNYNQAVEGVAKLRNASKGKDMQTLPLLPPSVHEFPPRNKDDRTYSLAHLMARYVGYLSGDETVPVFKRKERSKGHIEDVERTFLRFAVAAKDIKRDILTQRIDQIDDKLIESFYNQLTDKNKLNLGNAGYNRAITVMSSFFEYLKESEGYQVGNPFADVVRKPTKQNVETIEADQFSELIEAVKKPELGIHTFANGKKKNYWRPFLPEALELCLYTGRRRTEVVLIQWPDIHYENDKADYIPIPDYKYIHSKGLTDKKDWKYNYVPVTEELSELLDRLGAKENRGTNKYILAPDTGMSRESLASFLSKAFAHYAQEIGIDLSLGSLRRTNISSLSAEYGLENARTITGHAGLAVIRNHYASKKVLSKAAKDFKVFKKGSKDAPETSQDRSQSEKKDFMPER